MVSQTKQSNGLVFIVHYSEKNHLFYTGRLYSRRPHDVHEFLSFSSSEYSISLLLNTLLSSFRHH